MFRRNLFAGRTIVYGYYKLEDLEFGVLLLKSAHGICAAALGACASRLQEELLDGTGPFGQASLSHDGGSLQAEAAQFQDILYGKAKKNTLILDLANATPFQLRCWNAMDSIPRGQVRTYANLARHMQTSPRAVGGACADNRVAAVIPCHRVVGAQNPNAYRWGKHIKLRLLDLEKPSV